MVLYVMPSSSIEGLAILYGIMILVVYLRVPKEYQQSGLSEVGITGLAIVGVWGFDWLLMYLTRPDLPTLVI